MQRFILLLICFITLVIVVPGELKAAGIQTINPSSELRPSYEDKPLPEVVAAGLSLTPPTPKPVPHELIVNEGFDAVFERLLHNLPATGVTINTANTKTGIITAALSTEKPEALVDLGITRRIYGAEEFVFPTAAPMEFKLPYYNENEHYYLVRQTTSLNCLVSIQVARLKSETTKIMVNVNYQFTLNTGFENTAFRKSAPPAETKTVTFMTNEHKEVDLGIMGLPLMVTPQSKGVLEQAILDCTGRVQ